MTDANTGGTAPALLSGTGLAATAYARLVTLFAEGGHRPSLEQWEAIADLLQHLENVANGKVEDAVYVSAIPCGTGKSTSIAAFASALCDNPNYANVGVLILCNRVTEVHDMADKLRAHCEKLCVIVAEKHQETRALGDHTEANRAQVVVATQASLKGTLRSTGGFPNATRYHYVGARRAIVCWDEAISFSRPVALDGFVLAGLAKAMSQQSPMAAGALLQWAGTVTTMPDGVCDVPDFSALGVDLHDLEDAVADNETLAAEAKALSVISGGKGYVKRDTPKSAAIVKAIPELPESLLPVTVTDASAALGVHHASYEQMATTRRVVHLKAATKTYRNLALRIVPTKASRSVYRDKNETKGLELIEMAVRYVRSVAPADVLIVSYKGPFSIKGVKERTIAEAIDARLTEEELWHPIGSDGKRQRRVRHLTFGNHTATNEHAQVRHVVLMGHNFVPKYASYAASGAALDKAMASDDPADHPTERQVAAMRIGMLRDATLQALLRGHARMGIEGDCGAMEAVVPQVRQSGLSEADWAGMFPGARMTIDHSLLPRVVLKGKVKQLAELVESLLNLGLPEIKLQDIGDALGVTKANFSRLLKRADWKAWMDATGLTQERIARGALVLRCC